MMNKRNWTIKLEQFHQARRIHGGLLKLLVALVAIKLARVPLPSKKLRLLVYRKTYSKKYPPGLNEMEADRPLWAYRSLNAMFTRGIKPEFRSIPAQAVNYLCPCDGTIQDIGRVENGKLLTLKGIEYTLDSLLVHTDPGAFEGCHFAVIFLSPIDCHRIFSPYDGRLEEVIHVPGFRLLVHPPYQKAEFPVYTLNERMIFRFTTALGPCGLVMVAGWGVGNISLPIAPEFRPKSRKLVRKNWTPSMAVRSGQWIATFELGSTVVLLAPPAVGVPLASPNEKVRYGQPLFGHNYDE
jgi:phosphatidylserine decarboxylase